MKSNNESNRSSYIPNSGDKKTQKNNVHDKHISNNSDPFLENEEKWFADQGAKCSLQSFPPHSVACEAHLHDAIELIYVKKGSFIAYNNNNRYDLAEGDLLFFQSLDIHRTFSGKQSKNEYYCVKIHPSLIFDMSDKRNGASYMLNLTSGTKNVKRMWKKSELAGTHLGETFIELEKLCALKQQFFDIKIKKILYIEYKRLTKLAL